MIVSNRLLVLASASPRRRDLLHQYGLDFHCLPADIDERQVTGDAALVACTLSALKARWVYEKVMETNFENAHTSELWILGSDTVVAFRGDVIGKPADDEDARRILGVLSGNVHQVVSGVSVVTPDGEVRQTVEMSSVMFRTLTEEEIAAYVASGDAEGKSGAYGIQSGGASLIEGFEGCYFNIVGLPIRQTFDMLELPAPDCGCECHRLQLGDRGCE